MNRFAPTFDMASAASKLKQDGRVHIPNALSETDADALLADMHDARWATAMIDNKGEVFRVNAAMVEALDVGRRTRIIDAVNAGVGSKFQYLYDKFSVDAVCDAGRPCPPALAALYAAFNSPTWLNAFKTLTGDDRVAYVNCHASRFRPGHFLTTHDDTDPAKARLFAYVLNLTRVWSIEWGGLLQFHGADGHVSGAFTPRWNALNVFAVPAVHSVSMVAPAAPADRLSITGWLQTVRTAK
jgi:SM-20-related protein